MITPIETITSITYLGKDATKTDDTVWYFYALNKDNVGRIIRYVTYPFWAGPNQVSCLFDISVSPPKEVENDVRDFVEGRAEFNELPPKRGRKQRVVRTSLSKEGSGSSLPIGEGRIKSNIPGANRGIRTSDNGNQSESKITRRRRLPGTSDKEINRTTVSLKPLVKELRRLKQNIVEAATVPMKEAPLEEPTTTRLVVKTTDPVVVPIKRPRGRPRKVVQEEK